MKFINSSVFILILFFALSACKKSNPNPTDYKNTNVYVVGNVVTGGNFPVATYWKNGTQISLADSAYANSSVATGIAIIDTDVYISGAISGFATYWKNGKAVKLSSSFSYANSITVSGNDIYIAGYSNNFGVNTATYWKNGVPVLLDNGGAGAVADGIAVVGNDVFVVGNNSDLNGNIICWKNGVPTTIGTSPSSFATYNANTYYQGWVNIVVNGSDTYITGAAPGHLTAGYWKNGVANFLVNDPNTSSVLNNIAVTGSDVYAVGFYGSSATYWKSGALNILPADPQTSAMATAIAINGNDVYISGFEGTPFGKAVYWKNGSIVPLSSGSSVTTGIAIVQY